MTIRSRELNTVGCLGGLVEEIPQSVLFLRLKPQLKPGVLGKLNDCC